MQGLREKAAKAKEDLVKSLPNWMRNSMGSPRSGEMLQLEGATAALDIAPRASVTHPKLMCFNHHGRIDYCLEEGLFENSYIAAISSHVSYWEDIDVASFLAVEIGGLPQKPVLPNK